MEHYLGFSLLPNMFIQMLLCLNWTGAAVLRILKQKSELLILWSLQKAGFYPNGDLIPNIYMYVAQYKRNSIL